MATAPKGYKNITNDEGKKVIVPSEDAKHIQWVFEEIAKGTHTVIDILREARKKD